MNRVSGLNYVLFHLNLKCLQCETLYRLQTFLKTPSVSKSKFTLTFYSTAGQPAVNHNFVSELSENGEQTVAISDNPDIEGKSRKKDDLKDNARFASTTKYVSSLELKKKQKDVLLSALKEKEKGIYLVEQKTAQHLAGIFAPELKDDCLVIEANPGLGFLTKHLLDAGLPYIRLFESSSYFFDYLKEEQFPETVDIYHKDIIRFWKMQFFDKKDGGKRMAWMFSGISKKKWEEDPVVKVVAAIPDKHFITCILENIITQTGFVKHGRPEFFIVIDPLSYYFLTNHGNQDYKHYKPFSVLFQLLFDYQILLKVPRKVFLPWGKENKRMSIHQKELLKKDGDVMYAVKFTPCRDCYSNSVGKNLPMFHYFLKQIFSPSNKRIIPKLEEWAPGCGPKMIAMGYNVYTEVAELTPQQIQNIYLSFLSWSESIENSSFFASMESYLLKKQDIDEIHEDD